MSGGICPRGKCPEVTCSGGGRGGGGLSCQHDCSPYAATLLLQLNDVVRHCAPA